MSLAYEVLVIARNETQQGLADVKRDIAKAVAEMETTAALGSRALARTQQTAMAGFTDAGRAVRLLAAPLVSELNPALGATIRSAASATSALGGFAVGMGLGAAAIFQFSAATRQYITDLREAADFQGRLNIAIRTMDFGAATGQLRGLSDELERLKQQRRFSLSDILLGEPQQERAAIAKKLDEILPGGLKSFGESLTGIVGRMVGDTGARAQEIAKLLTESRAKAAETIPLEKEARLAEAYGKQAESLARIATLQLDIAKESGNVGAARAKFTELLGLVATQAQNELAAFDVQTRRTLADIGETFGPEGVAAFQPILGEQRRALVEAQRGRRLGLERSGVLTERSLELDRLQAIREAALLTGRLDVLTGRSVVRDEDLARLGLPVAGGGGGDLTLTRRELNIDELIAKISSAGNEAKEAAAVLRLAAGVVQVQRERIGLGGQIQEEQLAALLPGASLGTAAAIRGAQIEAQRQTEVRSAQLDLDETRRGLLIDLVNARAGRARRELDVGELERTDLFAGVSKGFREVTDELQSFGASGEKAIREFAETSQRYFSDLLFSPIEKGWKRTLEEVPKQFAMSTLRSLTDLFGRFATSQFFGTVGKAFPSVAALLPVAGGPLVGQATAGPLVGTGLQAVRALQGVTPLGGAPAPPGSPFSVPSLPVGSLLPSGGALESFLNLPLAALGSGGALGAAGEEAFALASSAAASGGQLSALGAATVGNALGIVGGAVGLGFTIAGALQGPPTAQNILMSGVSGAVSGAALGAGIGAIFAPASFGLSVLIGAIAGAALGAGAGAAGKGDTGERARGKQERSNTGHRVLDELTDAIQNGGSLEEIAGTRIHTGNTVGGLLLRIALANAAGQFAGSPWSWPPAEAATRTIEILAPLGIRGEEFNEEGVNSFFELVANWGSVGNAAEGARNAERLLQGFADRADQLQEQESNIPIAFDEGFAAVPGVGGISRRTFLPLTRIQEAIASGQPLIFSRGMVANMDDNAVELLIERINRVADARSLRLISRRRFSGEV